MEPVIWQLEALGELLSHSYVKNLSEDKLQYSTTEKVYLNLLIEHASMDLLISFTSSTFAA